MAKHEIVEKRPLVDRVAEKILGIIGVLFGIGIMIGGLQMLGYGFTVPMIVATAPLLLGVVMVIGGIVILGLIWRHFTR